MTRFKSAIATLTLALLAIPLSACQGVTVSTGGAEMTYTATAVPATDAETIAQNLLVDTGVELPQSATDLRVEIGSHPQLDGVFVIRFAAPRSAALHVSSKSATKHFTLTYGEEDMLGSTVLSEGALSISLWNAEARRTTAVFIQPGDPAEVVILSYVHTR